MMIKFILPISCKEDSNCAEAILKLIETKLGVKLHGDTETDDVEGHLSISHVNGAHKIWAFVYDNDGEHEGESDGVIVRSPNIRCKKPQIKPNKTKTDSIKILTQTEIDTEEARITTSR